MGFVFVSQAVWGIVGMFPLPSEGSYVFITPWKYLKRHEMNENVEIWAHMFSRCVRTDLFTSFWNVTLFNCRCKCIFAYFVCTPQKSIFLFAHFMYFVCRMIKMCFCLWQFCVSPDQCQVTKVWTSLGQLVWELDKSMRSLASGSLVLYGR